MAEMTSQKQKTCKIIITMHGLHVYGLFCKNAQKGFGIEHVMKAERRLGVERLLYVCTEPKEVSDLEGHVAHC